MARGDALERVLKLFRTKKQSGDGWQVCCPAHEDTDPSMHVKQGRVGVVMSCYAGCSVDSIVAALGLEMRDLFDDRDDKDLPQRPRSKAATKKQTVSIKTLARRFELDETYLREVVGLRQIGAAVGIPYRGEDGDEILVRKRVAMSGKRKILHPKGKPLNLYGADRIAKYREAKHPALFFVEGESDCWVLWSRGVSALGVPGASAVKVVEPRHVEGIKSVYIFQEPGAAGENFQLKLGERLQSVGFRGKVKVVSFREAKDPAELWAKDPDKFGRRFTAAVKAAADWSPVTLDDLVVQMSTVKRKEVSFLWKPYIPEGMVTILAGKPGLGKSFLVSALSAAITSGGRIPGNDRPYEPGNVLLFSAEDDPEYVLAGRLEDGGADLERVFAFDLANNAFQFGGQGFSRLESLVERFEPRLVVFDPIVSFTGTKVNINRQNEVRGALQPVMDIARRTGTSVLLVAHVGKGSSSTAAIDAIMGSVDFSAAPRSAMIVYPDPNGSPGEECGVLAHAKHNLSRGGRSLRYVIDDGRFTWRGTSTMSATDLAATHSAPSHESAGVNEAVDFLREQLLGEERATNEVLKAARQLGIAGTTLFRARTRLGVKTRREGFGSKGKYFWSLPVGADERDAEEDLAEQATLSGTDPEDDDLDAIPSDVVPADHDPADEDLEDVPI